ncbi:hypothetical protein [Kribbella speibonae]|uniref:Uncharacterized protein n=1 Tax=Kribbella speibonae TaxID=1572660 RepID=A0A4R0IST6_9ACTN|nr:hypothetical protein [Kribbella speibonae]TCC27009.1 hypothetical protein E0H58_03135 [Kribbella speibonae]TCC36137.1 hypothetical protein E0H92_26040 [Kribbella speibonae]
MAEGTGQAPQGWVPVEHRWFGLDRRTFAAGFSALAIALLLIYGLQGLNAAIPWHNEIRAGQVLDLGDGATAVPPVGWQLEHGTLTGGAGAAATSLQIVLASGGATIELDGTSYTGSAAAFLDQVQRSEGDSARVRGSRGSLTTDAGLVGVVESSTGPSGDAVDVAFKMAVGTTEAVDSAPALLVRVRTAAGQFERYQDEVATMLRSITPGVAR